MLADQNESVALPHLALASCLLLYLADSQHKSKS